MRAAFHTLGCKVNQYDTQAMLELMEDAGYTVVPFSEEADVYVLNTCTVTGTGDKKSLQLARRIRREHPDALLVLCGCLAQREGEKLLSDAGADLILGTQYRAQIVRLVEKVRSTGTALSAVSPLVPGMPFEDLSIREVSGHTRATVKIQEGCGNHCTYCIIPSVRGPVRSRPLENLRQEIERLRDAGFSEIVLTGIHLASYGRDFREAPLSLLDAIRTVHRTEGIQRIRLGSLEPVIATENFCLALKDLPKVCPQFHLALQSGSDTVLARMKRRYNTDQYRKAVANIRAVWPDAALTTDILTGFPGETEEEFLQTRDFIEETGFSRIHVFPYSPRKGTPAADMPDQIPVSEKERRARELIAIGNHVARRYMESWLQRETTLLPEERINGCWEGYTPEYIRVTLSPEADCQSGRIIPVRLTGISPEGMLAEPSEAAPPMK
ncbi:MAG: tRNA (N(6)-L-threonylcarbamoyladenosine(37)-C(2))-methylthiotransferase MtaB [Clostridia bacterium]|nr:tRNA (N(6)-L-threonylcarbamoyladenosine(37)-C(2))-methylthiotransferase MtaB [Clostridia bacterium]